MTEPNRSRPGSSAAAYHGPSIPSSPRPSVASRASGSSLRKEHERQETLAHARPASITESHSQSQSPQPPVAVPGETPQESSSFSPLFALLSTSDHPSQRQTVHHPTVHYIFADDDPESLSAALRQHSLALDEVKADEHSDRVRPSDRAILLDMAPTSDGTGLEVAWASSLTPDWAVVSAQVSRMEGAEGGNTPAGEHNAALMLKIEGVSIDVSQGMAVPWGKNPSPEAELQSSGGSLSRPTAAGAEEYATLLSDFDKRMGLLRRVVEASTERHRIVQAAGEVHEGVADQNMEAGAGPGPIATPGSPGYKD
ncbi:hypothetical protein V8F20_009437 [Naviculisporaceae sp. PSN 640]